MWFKITNLLQGNFFGKLTNITFAYLLNPIILENFKKIPRADP